MNQLITSRSDLLNTSKVRYAAGCINLCNDIRRRNPNNNIRRRDFRPGPLHADIFNLIIASQAQARPYLLKTTGMPPSSIETSMTSRVVPGCDETMAASRAATRLRSDDLPTLGHRQNTTFTPDRKTPARSDCGRRLGQMRQSDPWFAIFTSRKRCFGHAIFIGKINGRFEMRSNRDQFTAPGLHRPNSLGQ